VDGARRFVLPDEASARRPFLQRCDPAHAYVWFERLCIRI
jgi:hypothetical protein